MRNVCVFARRASNYVFGGRSELQFEHATQVEAREAPGGAVHSLKTRMKRVLVNAESKSFTFELAKPVFLDVRCLRAPSRGLLPANCSRAAHWRWFHQLPDDSWLNCEACALSLSHTHTHTHTHTTHTLTLRYTPSYIALHCISQHKCNTHTHCSILDIIQYLSTHNTTMDTIGNPRFCIA